MDSIRESLGQINSVVNIDKLVDLTQDLKIKGQKSEQPSHHGDAANSTTVENEIIDWEKERAEMDKVFQKQSEQQLKDLPEIPKSKIFKNSVKLYKYQEDGIAWLVNQERNPRNNPFHRESTLKDGTVAFYDRVTRRRLPGPFPDVQGSILADEMGLGKTIQTLGLILSSRSPVDKAGCTIIICPKSVISNWEQQIEQFVKPGGLRISVYAGDRKKRSKIIPQILNNEVDICLCTYETVSSEHDKKTIGKNGTLLPDITDPVFHRVVLDEAQTIRNPKAKVFKAVLGLAKKSKYRLALTGTPFINKPTDIYSLLNFVGMTPLDDFAYFKEHITEPIKDRRRAGLTRLRTGLQYAALRRTKATVDGLDIVQKTMTISHIPFPDGDHKKIHDCLYLSAQAAFEASINGRDNYTENEEGVNSNAQQAMFEMLLRVRQACASGELVPPERYERAATIMDKLTDENGNLKHLTARDGNRMIDMLQVGSSDTSSGVEFRSLGNSPKMSFLLDLISEMDPDEKGTIFSQFTSHLDIIERALIHAGYKLVRLDGSMETTSRKQSMMDFANDESVRFILCSLKAAGTGISLTRGNVVFMMEPWWNESTENQAIDRVHRIGQIRPVRVYRLVMKDSIEERMIQIQKSKAALGKGSMQKLSREEEKMAKVTTLKDLFQIKSREDLENEELGIDWS